MMLHGKKLIAVVSLAAVGAGLMAPGLVYSSEHERARTLQKAGEILPLEEITAHAKAQYPGRVLEVELEQGNGGYYYEVELLDEQGIVRELEYDAKTGDLLHDERD
jgi:uncharacterized membrane protein YkoI